MSVLDSIIHRQLSEAKDIIFARMNELVAQRLSEAKRYLVADIFEEVELDDWVVGFFFDGLAGQFPVMFGVIPGFLPTAEDKKVDGNDYSYI